MSMARVKKNDIVSVRTGADVGKTGKVLQVLPQRDRAVVEGVNLVKKHMRKSQDNPQGAITEKESPVRLSRLLLFCPQCKRGVRIRRDREAEKGVRKCRRCGHAFDG